MTSTAILLMQAHLRTWNADIGLNRYAGAGVEGSGSTAHGDCTPSHHSPRLWI